MNNMFRYLAAAAIALAVVCPTVSEVAARGRLLDENAVLALLERTLKHDGVYTRRISLDCVAYSTEEATAAYFQFVLRENHTAKCGGDPETSPVVDRYRVYRASGKIEWLERIEGNWQPYNPAKIK
jgi:type IV pilus biogenesis protein CpaD/CtpE